MTWRQIILSFICLLALTSPLLAQEAVREVMFEEEPFQLLTSENWDEAEMVGVIDGKGVYPQGWLDNSRIVALNDEGLWIYTLDEPDKTHLILRSSSAPISLRTTPNKRWLWFTNLEKEHGLFDVDNERYLGLLEGMMMPSANSVEVWSGDIMLLHPLDNHSYIDGFSNRIQIWDMSGSYPILLADLLYPRTDNTPYIITQAIVSADAKTLVTTARAVISEQRIVSIWDVETGAQRIIYQDPLITDEDHPVIALQWAEDESSFAVMTPTDALRFAMPTGEPLESFTYPWCFDEEQKVQWIDYQLDELICFSDRYRERKLDIWRLSDSSTIWTSRGLVADEDLSPLMPDFINNDSSTPSDWIIMDSISTDSGQKTFLVNYRTGEEKTVNASLRWWGYGAWKGETLSPDQSHVVVRTFPQERAYSFYVVDLEADTQVMMASVSGLWDLLFLPDGDLLTLGTNGITRYSFIDGTSTLLPIEAAGMAGMALHPDGRLYIGYGDGKISIYNFETETLEKLVDNGRPVLDLTFTPDGTKILVASESTVVLRDSEGGFLSQQPAVRFVTFNSAPLISADGQWASINHSLYQIEGPHLKSVAPEDVGECW